MFQSCRELMNCGQSLRPPPAVPCSSLPEASWLDLNRAPFISGAKHSAQTHDLPFEELSAQAIHEKFPGLKPTESMMGIWEPRAGVLFPEECIQAHLDLAVSSGAHLHYEETLLEWGPEGPGVRVRTNKDVYYANKLVLSTGSWLKGLWPECPLPLEVERQVLFWFKPTMEAQDAFDPCRCPIYIWEYEPERYIYGFPDLGHGVKVARHHEGIKTTPDTVSRQVTEEESAEMIGICQRFFPGLSPEILQTEVCLYTNTPDFHFILDHHPEHPQIIITSPCSGHGFKFSSAIGEILCYLVQDKVSPFDLDLFRLMRSGLNHAYRVRDP